MTDYEIQGPTRTCAATGRELKPGVRFHAVLLEQDGKLVRVDYADDAWSGPPADAVAHWSGRIPSADKPRRPAVNDEVLLGCFDRLKDSTDPDGTELSLCRRPPADAAQAIALRGRAAGRVRPGRPAA